ncbi:hypothetical protein PISMIDRAFT_514443 [Pisolithus microcarpus 441]|uniref:HIT domain-containing protein n=1 Tax=Pisolithus microcarpus 441 TaxID=765257 RepID=A0A0C9YTI1_9AGAM|nr:hypothetical protein BKA83DRAFT_514443 [Pisolithus microcarpus]KIK11203.1 hypothetical protein PISMIDRAFT_514443 [Pisolithus microcarpus 441]
MHLHIHILPGHDSEQTLLAYWFSLTYSCIAEQMVQVHEYVTFIATRTCNHDNPHD